MAFDKRDLILEATELRLGLPGTTPTGQDLLLEAKQTPPAKNNNKRPLPDMNQESVEGSGNDKKDQQPAAPPTKTQVVGWPPVRSYRKNCLQAKKENNSELVNSYIKVSMDGAPYLRKIDLKVHKGYPELLKALEDMFKVRVGDYSEKEGYNRSEFVPTYEDKDGDWMLVGDVPWDMFINSCKKLRIMKGSEARGLGCAV